MAKPKKQNDLANEYAEAADEIASRAAANQAAAFDRSIRSTLSDLRRFYRGFLDESAPDRTSFDGVDRRPYDYSLRQSLTKLGGMYELAKGFMSEKELKALQKQQRQDLAEAMELGGDLTRQLAALNRNPGGKMKLPPAQVAPEAVTEAAERASAYIRGEVSSFRDAITQTVQQGLLKGQGFRGIEAQVREALNGARDPHRLTQRYGLKQRAELIARSELANAFVGGQLRYAAEQGYRYVRWIATKDELACRLCASRHGVIYRIGDVVAPAHPRCRCVISPAPNEAVESGSADLLDAAYWNRSQEQMRSELAAANGWDLSRLEAEVRKALTTPTPSERRQRPGIEESAQPVEIGAQHQTEPRPAEIAPALQPPPSLPSAADAKALGQRAAAAISNAQKELARPKRGKRSADVIPPTGADPEATFNASTIEMGRGMFGSVRLTADGKVVKRGVITQGEVRALQLLKDSPIAPVLYAVATTDGPTAHRKGKNGYIVMDAAGGTTLTSWLNAKQQSPAARIEVFTKFLQARAQLHATGIAHNDMHSSNTFWDEATKKVQLIDFGLARIDPVAALIEGLGTGRGMMKFNKIEEPGDYQSRPTVRELNKGSVQNGNPTWKRFRANRREVERLLRDEGAEELISRSIRSVPRNSPITKERAVQLIQMLYEGVL